MRDKVIEEARTWIGTKYAHRGRSKGKDGGVDCAQSIYLIFRECGLCEEMALTEYTPDFFCHRGVERYMETVLQHCREVKEPHPGDIALFKIGRIFAHGGIVTKWPFIIHASRQAGNVLEERATTGWLAGRQVKFFSRWQDGVHFSQQHAGQ